MTDTQTSGTSPTPEQPVAPVAQKTVAQQPHSPPSVITPAHPVKSAPITPQQTYSHDNNDKQTWRTKLKSLLIEYQRVLRSTRKPEYSEVKTIVKVTGIGIIIIGAIGFLISMVRTLIVGAQ